jgi:hypothetical protein
MPDKTTGEAFQMLLHSRKFLLLLMDCVVSLILYFVSKYGGAYLEDVKFVILALQPVFWIVIAAIAKDNATEAQARAVAALSMPSKPPV